MKGNKYRAQRTNGFGSKLESAVYDLLMLRKHEGKITDIKCQQPVVLQPGPPKVRISWKVDFSFVDVKSGELTYCEAKGVETATYKLKLKMWRAQKPYRLEIWKGDYRRPKLAEVIERGESQ